MSSRQDLREHAGGRVVWDVSLVFLGLHQLVVGETHPAPDALSLPLALPVAVPSRLQVPDDAGIGSRSDAGDDDWTTRVGLGAKVTTIEVKVTSQWVKVVPPTLASPTAIAAAAAPAAPAATQRTLVVAGLAGGAPRVPLGCTGRAGRAGCCRAAAVAHVAVRGEAQQRRVLRRHVAAQHGDVVEDVGGHQEVRDRQRGTDAGALGAMLLAVRLREPPATTAVAVADEGVVCHDHDGHLVVLGLGGVAPLAVAQHGGHHQHSGARHANADHPPAAHRRPELLLLRPKATPVHLQRRRSHLRRVARRQVRVICGETGVKSVKGNYKINYWFKKMTHQT